LHPKLLAPLTSLASVGGSVVWSNNSIGDLDLSLVATTAHGLVMTNNPALDALDSGIQVIGAGPITIQDNPLLPTCAATNYIAAQTAAGWTGTASVSGNGTAGCP
jgi:hypothetical protein